jgi:hypothetical protein
MDKIPEHIEKLFPDEPTPAEQRKEDIAQRRLEKLKVEHEKLTERAAKMTQALQFYANKKNWVYSITNCRIEVDLDNGKLVIPNYPEHKFPALDDHGQIARTALEVPEKDTRKHSKQEKTQ